MHGETLKFVLLHYFLTTKNRNWHQIKAGIFKEVQNFEESRLAEK